MNDVKFLVQRGVGGQVYVGVLLWESARTRGRRHSRIMIL